VLAALLWLPGACLLETVEARSTVSLSMPGWGGPARIAPACMVGLALLVPLTLPLFVIGAPLGAACYTLGAGYVLVGTFAWRAGGGERLPPRNVDSLHHERGQWIAAALAALVLLPGVMRWAGGSVDDWWDLSFIRHYVSAAHLGFAEPVLGAGLVHPRFAWSSWFTVQALVGVFTGTDVARFQQSGLPLVVCLLGISALAWLCEAMFAPDRRSAGTLALLFLPAWAYGTEAFPYFVRLHQDKFVAALVAVPVLLGALLWALQRPSKAARAIVFLCALAACTMHSLVFGVGLFACACICTVRLLALGAQTPVRRHAAVREIAWTLGAAAVPVVYPLAQAVALGFVFSEQGIDLAHPDNPVVRAHLALGRLLWPQSFAYIVDPRAVFGPIALVGLVGLAIAVRTRRRFDSKALLALTVPPCVALFVPGAAATAGRFLVPWMLYRVGWLVPVVPLAGLALHAALQRRGGWRRAVASCAVLGLALVLAVPTGLDRIRRNMETHPIERLSFPQGTTLETYRFLATHGDGPVMAPPGFSELVPALTARPAVAISERGTLVFAGDERAAYRRLRDRAAFYAVSASPGERSAIAARYGVRDVVFRRSWITLGSEDRWLRRFSAEGYLQEERRGRSRLWSQPRSAVATALAGATTIVFENEDFFVVHLTAQGVTRTRKMAESADGATGTGAEAPTRSSWLDVFSPQPPAPDPAGDVVASLTGYPGADVRLKPVPLALGNADFPIWRSVAAQWEDAPDHVDVELGLGRSCIVIGVEVVPFLEEHRREVFEIEAFGARRRARAQDGRPIALVFSPQRVARVDVGVRSLLGASFGLADLRVIGSEESCDAALPTRASRRRPDSATGAGEYLEMSFRFPSNARVGIALSRRLEEAGAGPDAIATLREAIDADPGLANAWVELGLLLDRHQRPRAARGAFQQAVWLDSANAWAHGCLSWSLARAGSPLRALVQAATARSLDPRYADAYTLLGRGLRSIGFRGLAVRTFDEAVRRDPRRSWAVVERASTLQALGRRESARASIAAFLQAVPDDALALAKLRELDNEETH